MNITTSIKEKLNSARGSYGVYYRNLVTDEEFEVLKGTDDDVFESASVIKLWVMSAIYQAAEEGRLSLDQKIEIKQDDLVPGPGVPDYHKDQQDGCLTPDMFPESGILNYLTPGLSLSLEDIIRLMILISDNTAVNVLIDLLGKDEINGHIRSLGSTKTVLKRKLFEPVYGATDKENLFSLKETGEYFRKMYCGELVSTEASKAMCALLQNQQYTYKIPFFMRHVPIAHKTGEDQGIENDCGIVFASEPFVFCFASNEADEAQAIRLCQDIAKDIYDYVENTYLRGE